MVHGGVRTLFKLIGALVVVVLVAATLLAVRLSAGPLALDALVPYVEEALAAPDGSLRVRLESTGLAWQAGSGLDIRARGVHVLARDHTTLAAIPEMAVRLSAAGLLRGVLAPTAIELVGPRFKVVRRADGGMEFGLGDDVGAAAGGAMEPLANRLLDQLGGRAAADDPLSLLREVAVRDGAVEVDDRQLGANWRLRDAELRLSRRTGEVGGRLSMGLELAGTTTRMTADMAWRGAESRLTAKIAVDGLRPAPLARLGEPLAPLAGLDLPLSGRVDLAWRGGDGLERARFELAGEAGTVRLPAGVYPVRHVAGSGEWSAAGHRLALDHVAVDLGGPLLTASAVLEGLGGPMTMTAEATAQRCRWIRWPSCGRPRWAARRGAGWSPTCPRGRCPRPISR